MSAVSRTPAEKDTRKMVIEIPTTAPALRQLVASLGSVEIGSAGIENHKGCHVQYDYPHSIYTHSIPIHSTACSTLILLPLFCTLHLDFVYDLQSIKSHTIVRESHNWRPWNHSGLTKERGFSLLQEVSARKDDMFMEMIVTLPWNFRGLTHLKMSTTINECQVPYLEMLDTYIL